MRGGYAELLLILGLLCTATTICFGFNLHNSEVRCVEKERQALLEFKQGLQDNHSLLSSWGSHEEDCCNWKGIECSNRTGHVFKLALQGNIYESETFEFLSGEISSSILGLQHLTYLDLSLNDFSILPKFIGSLTKLQYLNLSYNTISGTIPQQLGNLSSLISLDLSWNYGLIEDHNLDWLSHLFSLRHIDMSDVNLSKVVNWPNKVNVLPSLLDLHLSRCELSMPVPSLLSNANSSSPLSIIDLSYNHLNSSVFPWLFKYTNSLVVLYLNDNAFGGPIPKAFGDANLHNLQVLDLSHNSISGEVPDLTKMSQLEVLDMSSNSLEGDVTEAHLSNLFSLTQLDLSFNSLLILKFSPNWVPPFHLDSIRLSSCKLGPVFPQWLQTQKDFIWLDISKTGISDTIPNWFWNLSNVGYLNLSRNNITSTIPPQWFLSRFAGFEVDLSYNRFSGLLPQLNFYWTVLNLSNNMFQGSITSICEANGSVSAIYSTYLSLDLSYNLLSGELPNCWANMPTLFMLNLANNRLSGNIPNSIGSMYNLRTLHLQNNKFFGELPKSMMNYSLLRLLDIGENRLSGRIPAWIGTSLPQLVVLRLPSNLFIGSIPLQLCHLTSLQILDFSHNKITGTIPRCLNNLTTMAQKQSSNVRISHDDFSGQIFILFYISYYVDNLLVNFKGNTLEYSKTLGLVKLIDLSSNKLKGEIPREITSLSGLLGLNLSRNLLTGTIPQKIGDMEILESLDLSRNHLSGIIPSSLTNLSFLSYLNLSNNNLSSRIPIGTQLQSFSASAYANNQDLCGLPLLKRCLGDEAAQGLQPGSKHGEDNIQEHANFHKHLWLYTSIALGFIVGFWGVCGSLLLKSSWRHAYFKYLDRIGDRFYVTIAINVAKFMRNFKTYCYQENI